MKPFLARFNEQTYAAMRIITGLLFACHGAGKVFGMFGSPQPPIASLLGVAGIIELVGGLLIAVGLFTPWAAFISSGQMAVAYFYAHAKRAPYPIKNGGELAVVYCFLFLFIAAHGAGRFSLDGKRSRR